MSTLTNYNDNNFIKMLLIGASGTGKTGALASLAKAGYNLRIIDFDNGLESLAQVLKGDAEALARVEYSTHTEILKDVNGKLIPKGTPKAFSSALKMMTHWKSGDTDLGNPSSWTNKDILVIDSLTFMGKAAMWHTLSIAGALLGRKEIQHWGAAMDLVENVLSLLCSEATHCHVIVLTHITYQGINEDNLFGYPSALGNKLPPKVGTYFNHMLQVDRVGSKRSIRTTPTGSVDIKCPSAAVPKVLPIETGLADYFKTILTN